jgi:hypothetical protein
VLDNNVACFPWLVMAAFDLGVLAMTGVLLRDGLPGELPAWVTIAMTAFFWLGAITGTVWAYRRHRIRVIVDASGGQVRKRWVFRTQVIPFTARSVQHITVTSTTDSDGDPYYLCQLKLRGTPAVQVAEGHDKTTVEQAAQRLRRAIADLPPER